MINPIIIIGTGLAGYNVAKEFRKLNTTTPLLMLTEDDGTYYSKPMLSSAFTLNKTPDTLSLGSREQLAEQLQATILPFTRAIQIDTQHQCVITENKKFEYSQCVIASGARVISAPLQGSGVSSVLHVNNLMDYRAFRKVADTHKTIALLGAGLIGCEFANDLLNAGKDVHCIALSKTPLDLLLPELAGSALKNAMEKKGVRWHLEKQINKVEKIQEGLVLHLSGGEKITADCLLSAIGIRPDVTLAFASHLKTNRGIVVNEFLQASAPNVYALGDCAEVSGLVLQYVMPLLQCSRALAKTLNGEMTAVKYEAMPIVVKTPAYPIAVCQPREQGTWVFITEEDGMVGRCTGERGELLGFILTNTAVRHRGVLQKEVSACHPRVR